MGDRGNIAVIQERGQVWFYTHWSGSDIAEKVQTALARKQRWDDEPYLARIIFDTLTEGQVEEETGFGISTELQDNEHPIIVVDVPRQRVFFIEENALKHSQVPKRYAPIKSWSFTDFVARELSVPAAE